jgi:hypothetical protein
MAEAEEIAPNAIRHIASLMGFMIFLQRPDMSQSGPTFERPVGSTLQNAKRVPCRVLLLQQVCLQISIQSEESVRQSPDGTARRSRSGPEVVVLGSGIERRLSTDSVAATSM